jgi:hypothetical protein
MQDSIILKFKGQSFTLNFPTVGQYRDIQVMKQTLSMNNYSAMYRTMMVDSEDALDMIDIEANLSVLCPEFIKALKVPFNQLGLVDYIGIRDEYKRVFEPWWLEIMKLLRPEPIKIKDEVVSGQ